MANNPAGDPNCIAWWRFENNLNDSQGGNNLSTGVGPSFLTSSPPEGSYYADYEYSTGDYSYLANASLDSGFPGKSGDSVKIIGVVGYLYIESIPANAYLIGIYDYGANKRSWVLRLLTNGDLHFYLGHTNGTAYEDITLVTGLSTGVMYHFAFCYQDSDGAYKLRIRPVGSGATNYTGNSVNYITISDAPFMLNCGYNSGSPTSYGDTRWDEIFVFNRFLNDTDIDALYAGTYDYSTTAPPTTSGATTLAPTTVVDGSVCWGHDIGVTEANTENFLSNWSEPGSTAIVGGGDNERVLLYTGGESISPTWHYGAGRIKIEFDNYSPGSGSGTLQYKNGSTQANCEADSWHDYVGSFVCTGWVKVRIAT